MKLMNKQMQMMKVTMESQNDILQRSLQGLKNDDCGEVEGFNSDTVSSNNDPTTLSLDIEKEKEKVKEKLEREEGREKIAFD